MALYVAAGYSGPPGEGTTSAPSSVITFSEEGADRCLPSSDMTRRPCWEATLLASHGHDDVRAGRCGFDEDEDEEPADNREDDGDDHVYDGDADVDAFDHGTG
ncbi:hypothetical protein GMORB2_4900 [Geosmithia morbida]|uniref:Uncharacterized protein n=1 Tax=Geosmithia morbida TaxID=1094350 RepID=A0A9P4YPS4_9HYPO|nr:uncharacterized protein GMORB2_4900 [Geosmithia morbida]KAF4119381.1 hypothetical protein GMORB2_4900 [Geosmithia morbida]